MKTPTTGSFLRKIFAVIVFGLSFTSIIDVEPASAQATAAEASFVGIDSVSQGNWVGKYGADGYSIPNSTQALPAYASFSPLNQMKYTWSSNTADPRALQINGGAGRIAATWYSDTTFSLDINLTDGKAHQVAVYALDWDVYMGGRSETLQVVDASSNVVLDSRSISSFVNGIYLVWNLSGHVRMNVITNGGNAVLSGIFFGGSNSISQGGQGKICVNPTLLSFGNVNVGSTGSQQALIINCGNAELSVENLSIGGTGYSISHPTLPIALAPGQSLPQIVTFYPTAIGNVSGALTITTNLPTSTTVTNATATGVGVAPVITSQPANQTLTSGQAATFSVADTGTIPMSYQWMKNGLAIPGATSSTYSIPSVSASYSGSQFDVQISNCVGTVISAPALLTVNSPTYFLRLSASSVNFGSVNVSTSQTQNVTVTNAGTGSITISGISSSGPGFNPSGISAGTVLGSGQSAVLAVSFTPAVSGSALGTITIRSNATAGAQVISLSGTGTAPIARSVALSWSPSPSDVVGYNVYVSTLSGTGYVKLTGNPVSSLNYVDTGLTVAETRYYVVTSVDSNGNESAFSSQVSAIIP